MRDKSGRWLKGQSANPSGRRPEVAGVREAAQRYTVEAIEVLASIMKDVSAPHSARASAAATLLDRGHGRAPLAVDARVEVAHSVADTAAEVLMALSERAKQRRADEARVIDAEPLPMRQ